MIELEQAIDARIRSDSCSEALKWENYGAEWKLRPIPDFLRAFLITCVAFDTLYKKLSGKGSWGLITFRSKCRRYIPIIESEGICLEDSVTVGLIGMNLSQELP